MKATDEQLTLRDGDIVVVVDVGAGGRVVSISIAGTELLWSGAEGVGDSDPLVWGMYPMVPFAGRIRNGAFSFDGVDYELPATNGPHAIHGYGFVNSWTRVDDTAIQWEFGDPWPFAGRVTQRYSLSPDAFTIEMHVEAIDRQPMLVGWHPWFVRDNAAGTLEVDFPAESMYQRDDDGMPAELVAVQPGPWDDCFTNIGGPPKLRWGNLEVTLTSDLDHWVVYNEPQHALCVEPQSGPPNEINTNPRILEAGEQLTATFTLSFSKIPASTHNQCG